MVANLLGLGHHVSREQNARAALVLGDHLLAQHPHADRIEPAERLVQNQQVRLVNDRGEELDLLAHALRQLLAALVRDAFELDALQTPPYTLGQASIRHAVEASDVLQIGADLHLAVHAALLGQISDAVLRVEGRRPAEHLELAGIGEQDGHDHSDRRRLAGAVGSDEAVQGTSRHLEVQAVDGNRGAESFRYAAKGHGPIGAVRDRGFAIHGRPPQSKLSHHRQLRRHSHDGGRGDNARSV